MRPRSVHATWIAMLVAMMFPAVAPVIVTFDQWRRQVGRAGATTLAFVARYLVVWSALGVVAYVLLLALQAWVPPGNVTALRVGAVLLVVAGVYQLTPHRTLCLHSAEPEVDVG